MCCFVLLDCCCLLFVVVDGVLFGVLLVGIVVGFAFYCYRCLPLLLILGRCVLCVNACCCCLLLLFDVFVMSCCCW